MDGLSQRVSIAEENFSDLQLERLEYRPALPDFQHLEPVKGESTVAKPGDRDILKSWFPALTAEQPVVGFTERGAAKSAQAANKVRVGVLFAGRQTPGAANVVCGLYDHLSALNPDNELFGFEGGTLGLFEGRTVKLNAEHLRLYRNQGGMHLLGRSVDRIRSPEEQDKALKTCLALHLDGLVIIGGTISATDAAHLAEYFESHIGGDQSQRRVAVIAVPAGIDGDFRNEFVEISLGHDTATKVYSQLSGNLATDALSARKYYFLVKLMGRVTSNIALEVALNVNPTLTLLPEDIEHRRLSLFALINEVADLVEERANTLKKNYGVIVIGEGVLSAIPEIKALLSELDLLLPMINSKEADGAGGSNTIESIASRLTPWSAAVLRYLPPRIQRQLLLPRESSGGIQYSQVSSEEMVSELVGQEIKRRAAASGKKAVPFATISTSLGYQARSSLPSNFDCALGSALGHTAAALAVGGFNGYCATLRGLANHDSTAWKPCGVPLTAMLSFPSSSSSSASGAGGLSARGGSIVSTLGPRPVIQPAAVDVHGEAFREYQARALLCRKEDLFRNPGPIQFEGPSAHDTTISLSVTKHDYLERIAALKAVITRVHDLTCRPGVPAGLLDAAMTGMTSLAHILDVMAKTGGGAGAAHKTTR